ncbi:MAG TPA: cupin domain-containing protein [Croceibacterium sp.]
MAVHPQLAGFDAAAFLRERWQKKPLLLRDAWVEWANPLDPDELAGLACEDGVESRLVERAGDDWSVAHGPFPEARLESLRRSDWTLLVQAVDQFVPAVAALIEPFRFVPDWRIDDVMVSLAANGGGVGPHFDQYDVFLVQGLGRRRWRIGPQCDATSALLPHDELRLLAGFEAVEEHVLEPGDILYVPPGVAHDGVAESDDCMTYSIGFRAPSRSELLSHFCDHVVDSLVDDDRYADPDLGRQDNPGEIAPAALARLQAMITEAMQDRAAFARWFGAYVTTPKYPELDWAPDEPLVQGELRRRLAAGERLCRNPASRFSFVREGANRVLLFVDGQCHACSGKLVRFAESLCAQDCLVLDDAWLASAEAMALIGGLVDDGSLVFE